VGWEQIGPDWKPENHWEEPREIDLEDHFANGLATASRVPLA
jgi:hypothetical protein